MIPLTSKVLVVKSIAKKTKAALFKDVEVGDRLQFEIKLRSVGRGRGLYATYVTARNLTKGVADSSKSQTEISNILQLFELEEENEPASILPPTSRD